MRFVFGLLAALAVILFSTSPTLAAEKKTVPANKTSVVGFFYFATGLQYGCHSLGRAKVRITNEPDHGTVRTEWRRIRGKFANGCKNTEMGGLAVWYTPHKGYRGKDNFSFFMSLPGLAPGVTYGAGRGWTIKLDVQ